MIADADDSPRIDRAFGAESRLQLLDEYFSINGNVTPANAWQHVYQLLLWTDRTTGLAHCYESDKAQPGRKWYERSLAFHDWLARSLGVAPHDVAAQVDWLFRRGTERLATILASQEKARSARAAEQRAPYAGRGFPEPGEDPALESLIRDALSGWLTDPPTDAMRQLTDRIRTYFGQENKRKNLVGEGFEDVLAALVRRAAGSASLTVTARPLLHEIEGFRAPPGKEKARRVDLAIVDSRRHRTLVSAKWSIRADREEQFGVDFDTYARLEDAGKDFDFVLITNEFDAARLTAACDRRSQNAALFTAVVHMNPLGAMAAYGQDLRRSSARLAELVQSGRLMSLEKWLSALSESSG